MILDTKPILKAFAPKIMNKAMEAFDRATTIVVVASWIGAVVMLGFALYTVNLSIAVKKEADAAIVAEPNLPQIVRGPVDGRTTQAMLDRLQKRYPEISFALHGSQLSVTATEGGKFHQWLTSLSYVDTIAPDSHWSILTFCVGKCGGNDLMRATLVGEQISFRAPDTK